MTKGKDAPGALQPAHAGNVVLSVGDTLEPVDVDSAIKMHEALDRQQRTRIVLRAWSQQQRDERELRKRYALALFIGLGVELVVIFAAFFLAGFGLLKVDNWMAHTFLDVALVQTAGLVGVVVRYLFPNRSPVEIAQLLGATDAVEPRKSKKLNRGK